MNFNIINDYADFIAFKVDDLPPEVLARCSGGDNATRDYVTALEKGSDWLFAYTRKYQPLTGSILSNANWFIYGAFNKTARLYSYHLAAEINQQIVLTERNFRGRHPDDDGYDDLINNINQRLTQRRGVTTKKIERHLSLPEPLRMAYYYRFDGMNIPNSPAVGVHTRLLPFPIGRPWQSIDRYLSNLRLKSKLLYFYELFPEIKPQKEESASPNTNLMIFLDTRPNLSGKEGSVFFVKNHLQDGKIYHISNADVGNLMVINNPAEAFDRYCEHILLQHKTPFNFLDYSDIL